MYFISKKRVKGKLVDKNSLNGLMGFVMASRGRGFVINNEIIKNVNVVEKRIANSLATKKALSKYNKLISLLTDLLISDDDTGDTFREALNHIEKFRLEIKIKYRNFLKKKELEMMSKQLMTLKKEADRRLLEIHESYVASKSSGKGK
mgnify:CR=1 FL=1